MIPIRLTMQGIYSYQGTPQTIEFGPLLDAGLFGIFGAVGSGKSSILEAISMALYGEIERLNKRDDRNYNMMNLRSDRLYIGFEFRNYAGQIFRFECEGRRNSKQYNEVNTYRRMASEWVDGEWLSLGHCNGEQVTGLSYENFKRTVIIPQGKFQDFLELTPGGRSQMLQDLFALDKYDLAGATTRLTSQNKELVHRLEGQLTGYEEVTPEAIKGAREQLQLLQSQVEKSVREYEDLHTKLADSIEIKQLDDQLKSRQTALKEMTEKEPDVRAAETELKHFQEARRDFIARISQINQRKDTVSQLQKTLDGLASKEMKLHASKEQINQNYEKLNKAIEGHEVLREDAESAGIAGKLRTSMTSLDQKDQRIKNGMKSVIDLQDKIENNAITVDKLEGTVAELKSNLPDRELLLELRSAFDRKEELLSQIEKLKEKTQRSRQTFLDHKKAFFEEFDLTEYVNDNSKVTSELKSRISQCMMKKQNHRDNLHQLQVQAEMARFVEQLTAGESCPLCGSKDHPAPAHFEAAEQQIEKAQSQIAGLESQQNKHQKALLEWKSINNAEKDWMHQEVNERKEVEDLEKSLREIEMKIKKHAERYPDFDLVERDLVRSARMKKTLEKSELEIKRVRQEIREETTKLDKYRQKVDQFKSECDQMRGEINSLKSSLVNSVLHQLDQHSAEEWHALSQKMMSKIKREKEEFRKVADEREKIMKEYIQLETSLKETKEYLNKEKKQLRQSEEELEQILSLSNFQTLAEVRQVLDKNIDVEMVQKRIQDHDRDMHMVTESLRDLHAKIGDLTFDGEAHDKLIQQHEKSEKELQKLREELNYQRKMLKEFQKRLDEKKKLTEELSRLHRRAENLKVLEGLFRGKKFVDYISTVYLREICEIANRRFKALTNNHYSLVLGEDNQFLVRDFLHDGQIRSVKTLSGGQTFQVSLCLAVALAESLQNQNQSHQNFFFLDEGFGTLDGDALRLVMESLKALRKEGRVVGVISHVESLQDEIAMNLYIRNDAEKGSHIHKSWEE